MFLRRMTYTERGNIMENLLERIKYGENGRLYKEYSVAYKQDSVMKVFVNVNDNIKNIEVSDIANIYRESLKETDRKENAIDAIQRLITKENAHKIEILSSKEKEILKDTILGNVIESDKFLEDVMIQLYYVYFEENISQFLISICRTYLKIEEKYLDEILVSPELKNDEIRKYIKFYNTFTSMSYDDIMEELTRIKDITKMEFEPTELASYYFCEVMPRYFNLQKKLMVKMCI